MSEEYRKLNDNELEAVSGGKVTNAGMVEWAIKAYGERWSYVWGGSSPGAVDSSGLIYSYSGGARTTEAMYGTSVERGSISTMPEIPGLGLYQPGHVGVYVGSGMCIHAKSEQTGVVYESVSANHWTSWFKIPGIEY